MSRQNVDPRILALCEKVTKKRARTVIDHLLEHGHITTEELQELYDYDHPPRAARDVREEGIPLVTFKTVSQRTGRKIGAYKFDDPGKIKRGRIGGRKAFSKAFKQALIDKYGEQDTITRDRVDARYLQIDHRIPYEVAGDLAYDETNLDAYMLLDGSSQRAKSFSCENCENWRDIQDEAICRTCYWAYPEHHTHAAMHDIRRVDLRWSGPEGVAAYDELKKQAEAEGVEVNTLIKNLLQR